MIVGPDLSWIVPNKKGSPKGAFSMRYVYALMYNHFGGMLCFPALDAHQVNT